MDISTSWCHKNVMTLAKGTESSESIPARVGDMSLISEREKSGSNKGFIKYNDERMACGDEEGEYDYSRCLQMLEWAWYEDDRGDGLLSLLCGHQRTVREEWWTRCM